MEINVILVLSIVTYILGSITKIFRDTIPTKFIPIQNVIIGVIGAVVCFFYFGLFNDLGTAMITCISATLSAGGFNGLIKFFEKEE